MRPVNITVIAYAPTAFYQDIRGVPSLEKAARNLFA
jgi:hypothetical protein